MRKLAKIYFIELFSLYIINQYVSGMVFSDQTMGILLTSLALSIASILIKPVVNILILPLTLATLGLFRFLSHAITLYIVDLALEEFTISSFYFPGFSSTYFELPQVSFSSVIASYIAFSILLSLIGGVVHWITK